MTDLSRLSLNTATAKLQTLAECVEAAAEAGLGAVGPWRDRVQEVGAAEAGRIIRDAGLRTSSLCRGGFLTAVGEQATAEALADNRRALEEAAAIGAGELVMVVGGLPEGDRDIVAARQRVADGIAALVPHAQDAGVRLALEPMNPIFAADRGVLSTLEQSLEMAAPFPAEAVGVVVDTYHVWWDPKLQEMIARAGAEGRISSYQVCDWELPLKEDTLNSRGYMGDGHCDFTSTTQWVRDAGYTGDIEVEIFNVGIWEQGAPTIVATMAQRYADLVLPHL
ncbi:sugar phosphate isomerase/epimerase family protein [Parenemella sanctibonifatiensis]|uniref:Xylose isomerase-like TIM barrel domain-containing protein n=1 Tax=Parenemella sanctibonifatiensis TaxID=2016505 RepID=A0A255EBD7_9ACTN|nr:sugar phosphate isomerase/epimerase family protein [Parenemella sanctibonifatiensis]OYN88570.1 hypothetical protein CGZ91_13240 [Parenemella sanctibonifatiensis]